MTSIKLDLHVHTIYSGDSLITPENAIKYAIKKGLDGFAICDHHTIKAFKILKKRVRNKDLIIIPGMEIETDFGEIIALFIDNELDIKNNAKDNNFFTIVQKIKENNGIVVIPHPFDFLRMNRLKVNLLSDDMIKKYIDGIEIINSRIIFKRCINKARAFNKKFHLFETGGSDAHSKEEIGNAYTLIRDINDNSYESIKKNLLSKNSESMGKLSSPFVHFFTIMNKLKKGLYF